MTDPEHPHKADVMRDAVAKLYTPWKDRKHKPKRRHKNFDESIGNDAQRVLHVRPDDILFGRGRAYQNHPGNRRMRAIVFKHKPQYDKVHRSRKREVVEAAYSEITEDGARFLYKAKLDEQDQDSYAIVNMQTALQKVRNTLGAKLSAKEKREAALKMMDDHHQEASSSSSSTTSKTTKGTTTTSTVASKTIGTAVGGKLAASELPSTTTSANSTTFKMKEDLGPELFSLRQQEPSSLLGLMPRQLSAATMLPYSHLPGVGGLEASLLTPTPSAAGLYYPTSRSFAATLDPMMMTAMGPPSNTSLLLGAGRFPSPILPYSSLLTGRPGLFGSAAASSLALEEEQRQQLLASREASLMAATRAGPRGPGLRSPYL